MAASFSISLQEGVTAVLRTSAASSNSRATASHLPNVSRTATLASGGASEINSSLRDCQVARAAAMAMIVAAANSTPRARYSMTVFDTTSTGGVIPLRYTGGVRGAVDHPLCPPGRPTPSPFSRRQGYLLKLGYFRRLAPLPCDRRQPNDVICCRSDTDFRPMQIVDDLAAHAILQAPNIVVSAQEANR